MKVKLTRRDEKSRNVIEPIVSLGMGGNGHIPTQSQIWAAQRAYSTAHDAAPDDATRALVDLIGALDSVLGQTALSYEAAKDPAWQRLFDARDRLRTTPEGAALIRQAEERDDG